MKTKLLRLIFLGIIMTAISAFTIRESLVWGLVGIIFFGGCCILYIIKYFKPDFAPAMDSHFQGEESLTPERFQQRYDDLGIFEYHDDGFIVKQKKESWYLEWSQLRTVIGYKLDRYTTDTICIDVFCEPTNKSFTVHEETPGWFQFLIKMKEQFPNIDGNWEGNIAVPAFNTNLTVVYDYLDRAVEEVEAAYYNK